MGGREEGREEEGRKRGGRKEAGKGIRDVPWAALFAEAPTLPKPMARAPDVVVGALAVAGLAAICPNPRRPMPIPSRSSSLGLLWWPAVLLLP